MRKFLPLLGVLVAAFALFAPVGVSSQVWVNPAPMPTTPVTLPTVSPGAQAGVQQLHYGTGAIYTDTWPDTLATSTSITTATTTLVVAGTASKTMYVFFAGAQSTGTNTSDAVQLEYGQTTTNPCDTNTTVVTPLGVGPLSTSGSLLILYGGATGTAATTFTLVTSNFPLIVPANATPYNLCVVSSGTTISFKAFVYYAIHSN